MGDFNQPDYQYQTLRSVLSSVDRSGHTRRAVGKRAGVRGAGPQKGSRETEAYDEREREILSRREGLRQTHRQAGTWTRAKEQCLRIYADRAEMRVPTIYTPFLP